MGAERRKRQPLRYTDRALKVLTFAEEEARRLGHGWIGTHHLLLGLLREGEGIGAAVLVNLDVDVEQVTLENARMVTEMLTGTTGTEAP